MNDRSRPWLRWSARIGACLFCLFLSVFALDAFGHGKTLIDALPDFAIHLAPVLVLLAVVAVSWRWEWVGGVVFTGAAAWYASFARDHISWVVTISSPLLIVGVLYFWSWLHDRGVRGNAQAHP
jgi:hypothetical protein